MPRAHTILQNAFPYHVTARSINREGFPLSMDQTWEIMSNHLFFAHHAFGAQIHSFVLMPNHFHLLLTTPNSNLSQTMQYFMSSTTAEMNRLTSRINQAYGSRHFRCVVESPLYYLHAYKYVYRNPVEAGLTSLAELYPYSTLAGLLGFRSIIIPMVEDFTLFPDVESALTWINQCPSETEWRMVKSALKKKTFQLSKAYTQNRNSRLILTPL